jgi:hypothetical protein
MPPFPESPGDLPILIYSPHPCAVFANYFSLG